ncbi:MAG: hypothetical protein OHK0056_17680 [Bacteriovoracaceae bacterium]
MSLATYFKRNKNPRKDLHSLFICDRNGLVHGGISNEHHAIIYTSNVAKTVQFYTQAFGLKCEFIHNQINLAELVSGNCTLTAPTINRELVDFSMLTNDLSSTFNRALSAGAIMVQSPGKCSDGDLFALVRDGNGFLIEIIQES